FAQQLAGVVKRFLKTKSWRDTECIVVGGGLRDSRVGEIAVGRAGIILKETTDVELSPIHNDPGEAGLIGTAILLPAWMLDVYEAIVGVDIGGSNIRAGIVELQLAKAKDLSKAKVSEMMLWPHHKEEGVTREQSVQELTELLTTLISTARK